ncbi:glutamate-1-semialdehyde 2,1-aminomutase [Myxococcota bacterium]|nr:glutamate-1-semialdehyde 2,1-aminomutase [Myxococcota bacterium]
MRRTRSNQLFERANELIPGGVNSPVRAFRAVGGNPIVVSRAEGPYIYDVDGNRYIDFVGSWGPLILGHAHPAIREAVHKAADEGTSFGFATPREIELAERVVQALPSVEKVRFVNSGTEATMSALRLARGYTGRDLLLKFSGCYHGHGDAFLADAGSGLATFGIPASAGVPEGAAKDTITVPYNDIEVVKNLLAEKGESFAAIILEPIACNMGMVPPEEGFLKSLRELATQYGIVLIFDEVITGFRLGLGGAQAFFDIQPDLSTFGKIIGGGLPVGAYGGKAEIMNMISPLGPVYQAGTLSGNPLAMAAGVAALDTLAEAGFYQKQEEKTAFLVKGLREVLKSHGNPARIDHRGSIFYLYFKKNAERSPKNYAEVQAADSELFGRFYNALLEEGVTLAPSAFEVGFVSAAHEEKHLEAAITAVDRAFGAIEL